MSDLPHETPGRTDLSADALELFVLGAAIESADALHRAVETGLRPEDFSTADRATLYRALLRIDADGLPYDGEGLDNALSLVAPQWSVTRRRDLIGDMMEHITSSAWIDVHAQGVRRWAKFRRADRFARKALAVAPTATAGIDGWLERFAEGALKVCDEPTGSAAVSLGDAVASLVERRLSPETDPEGERLSTPWRGLTVATGGLRAGQLIILAARPKVGKSACVLGLALHAAQKGPVLFCSLEMTKDEVSERTLSILSGVDGHVATGAQKPTAEERELLVTATGLAARLPVAVVDDAEQTLTSIRAHARRMKARGGLVLVVVDYLQLVESEHSGREETREREVAKIARGLKKLAKDMGCPVIALSQLNRKGDDNERPSLRSLRESGALEQDANGIWFLHREKKPNAQELTEDIVLIVEAQRSGACGAEIGLLYRKSWMTFFEKDPPPSYTDAAEPVGYEERDGLDDFGPSLGDAE